MKRHYLHSIDIASETAYCSVCGFTRIYVPKARAGALPKVKCLARAAEIRELNQKTQERLRQELRSRPDWKPRHLISEINAETMTGVCSICGPTPIRRHIGKKHITYICVTKQREWARVYRRAHYVARTSNPHALSEIDEEKLTAICAKCGPVKIELYRGKKKINRRCINAKNESHQLEA